MERIRRTREALGQLLRRGKSAEGGQKDEANYTLLQEAVSRSVCISAVYQRKHVLLAPRSLSAGAAANFTCFVIEEDGFPMSPKEDLMIPTDALENIKLTKRQWLPEGEPVTA